MLGTVGALWGMLGVSTILSFAIYRLTQVAVDAFFYPFQWYHWVCVIAFSVFMAHSEGYMGFQKQFSPRVAARAKYLSKNPRPLHVALAPLFCIGYFHITPHRRRVIIALNIAIICLVIIVRQLSQPWRGIVDTGVVIGLIWGLITLFFFGYQAIFLDDFDHSPEVPEMPMK